MVCLTERARGVAAEIPKPPKLTEITPANISQFDFTGLDWNPYFSGKDLFGPVKHNPELRPGETLTVLIPSEAVQARVEAATNQLARMVLADSGQFALGAIPKGGLWLYEKLLRKIEAISPWGLKTVNCDNHLDIKSRYATETGQYQIISLPDPQKVNNKTYLLCEGVVDTVQTLKMAEAALSQPPYENVKLGLLLLLDKTDAHPRVSLPGWVNQVLFYTGDVWVSGCGPDTGQRFRDLDLVAVYQKLTS